MKKLLLGFGVSRLFVAFLVAGFVLLVVALNLSPTPSDSRGLRSSPADLLQEAADRGDVKSQLRLARAYAIGDDSTDVSETVAQFVVYGIHRDDRKAAVWYSKAAEQGEVAAERAISDSYWWGTGVSKDYRKSIYWAKKAAAQGDSEGQKILETCRMIVEADPANAYTTEQKQQMREALDAER